jgi:uncharacterized protein HemX
MNETKAKPAAETAAAAGATSAAPAPAAGAAHVRVTGPAAATPIAVLALLVGAAALILAVLLMHRADEAQQRLDQARADDQLRDQRSSQRELRLGALEREWSQAQSDGDVNGAGGGAVVASADLRHRREQLALLDIERLAEEVQLQLRLGAPPAAAVEALSAADARLSRLASPAALRVQTALRHDLARLRAAPDVDRSALAAGLDPLLSAVDHWHPSADPLHPTARPPAVAANAVPAAAAAGPGTAPSAPAGVAGDSLGARLRAWLGREFGDFLRIREVDPPDALLLAPAQQQLLRDRFRLGVLDLRQAILARDARAARAEAGALDALLEHYFDPNDPDVAAAQAQLRAAAASAAPAVTVSIDETLAALRAARGTEG